MNITITQSNQTKETVNSGTLLNKLYRLYKGGHIQSLIGYIKVTRGYTSQATELMTAFPATNQSGIIIEIDESGQYMTFADSAVEQALLTANLSADGVGMTLSDAAAASITSTTFDNVRSSILSFDEFNRFTTANGNTGAINSRFKDCTSLSSINLSELTYLRSYDFYNTAITTVNAPKLIGVGNGSGNYAFANCVNLTAVENFGENGSINVIPERCFSGCTLLSTVNLPHRSLTFKKNCFRDCASLTELVLPKDEEQGDDIQITLEANAFSGATFQIKNTECIKLIGSDVFGTGITIYGNKLILPKVQTLHSKWINGLRNVTELDFTGAPINYLGGTNFWFNDSNSSTQTIKTIKLSSNHVTLGSGWYQEFFKVISNFKYITTINDTAALVLTNPIGLNSFSGNGRIISTYYESGRAKQHSVNTHSVFLPKITSTYSATGIDKGGPQYTYFTRSAGGNGGTNVGSATFQLLYFKNITSFGLGTFYRTNVVNLVINRDTPPGYDTSTLSSEYGSDASISAELADLFGSTTTIGTLWVPDAYVQAYQANPLYSSLTIRGMSGLTTYATYADWETAEAAANPQNNSESPVGLITEFMDPII